MDPPCTGPLPQNFYYLIPYGHGCPSCRDIRECQKGLCVSLHGLVSQSLIQIVRTFKEYVLPLPSPVCSPSLLSPHLFVAPTTSSSSHLPGDTPSSSHLPGDTPSSSHLPGDTSSPGLCPCLSLLPIAPVSCRVLSGI